MDRDREIVLAAQSIVAHLPALLGDRADNLSTQLALLLSEWDCDHDPSVTDRLLELLTADEVTREWMAEFLRLSETAPASSRGEAKRAPEAPAAPQPPVQPPGTLEPVGQPARSSPVRLARRRPSVAARLIVWGLSKLPNTTIVQSPPPPAESQAETVAEEEATSAPEPPGTAYGLLNCPEAVVAEQEFELEVGLSERPSPGVAGAITLPATTNRTYMLSVQLLIFGFRLRSGESPQQTMTVSAAAPYPAVMLHLTPDPQHDDVTTRQIKAMYSVDGQPVGFAVRYATVTRSTSPAPELTSTASGQDLSIPSAPAPADLTVVVARKWGSDRELAWLFQSPHGLNLPTEAVVTNIGASPQDFASKLTNQLSASEGQAGVYMTIKGKGRAVAAVMPTEFWQLLKQAAKFAAGPPTVLFTTDHPYVPWELAFLTEPLDPEVPHFLCAQARVGRWLLPDDNAAAAGLGPVQPPPTQIRIDGMAVVSGVYGQPGQPRLKEAEAECAELERLYGAAKIDANQDAVLNCIIGAPPVEILHFAVHGKYDPSGAQDGLILVDGILSPDQVLGGDLPGRPLVFLNACQVGQANEVLGDYAGMAAAFLRVGASAVVAPLWSIDDATARSIALSFYKETLEDGAIPAEVIRRVRARFKPTTEKQSCTYLAYQFFGDPRLELVHAPAASKTP